jgi:cytochrome c-type biogenesis protein CcmH/NrfG
MNQDKEAVQWLRAALRQEPNKPQTYCYLGLVLQKQNKLSESKAALQKAIELDRRFADAYGILSKVYMAQGEQRLAQEAMAKAIELNPRLRK